MVALLPDLDSRFERLYGYLNDDVTRRRASVGLALQLAGESGLSAAARAGWSRAGRWSGTGLVLVEDPDRPLLTRGLRVPDRVAAHLLGDDAPDAGAGRADRRRRRLSHRALRPAGARADGGRPAGPPEGAGRRAAARRPRWPRWRPLGIGGGGRWTWTASPPSPDPRTAASLAVREALLRGAGLVAGPVEHLAEAHADVVRWLTEAEVPLLLVGASTWDPQWSARTPLAVDAPVLTVGNRLELWARELGAAGPEAAAGLDAAGWPGTWRSGRLRCAARSTRPGPRPSCAAAGSPPRTCAAAYGPRTPPGWNGWPGGSSRRSAGTTWCSPRPYAGR